MHSHDDTTNDGARAETLSEAQALALSGDYAAAVVLLETFLQRDSGDIPACRLLASVLELRALELAEYTPGRLVTSADFSRAQEILLGILEKYPRDVITLCDLGDHFLNMHAVDKASVFYTRALHAIEADANPSSWRRRY